MLPTWFSRGRRHETKKLPFGVPWGLAVRDSFVKF
jgi:hypothetical protein